jgi:TATA-binding protein-associated factor
VDECFKPILLHYIDSTSMLQKFLTAIIAEEWARQYTEMSKTKPDLPPLLKTSTLAQELATKTLNWLQGKPPPAYHEMAFSLSRIHTDCVSLLQMFSTDCKLPTSSIPFLGSEIDISGTIAGSFTIETAQSAVGQMYTRLKDSLGRTRKKELAVIAEKRNGVLASIERYSEVKAQHDIRVSAAFAAAYVAFKSVPDKVSPVVKGIMNGIKVRVYDRN